MPTPTDPNMAQAWISGTPPDQTIDFYIPRGNTGPIGPVGPIGPSLSVGTIETVSGPAAPGTVGAQGPIGLKGDPGGVVLGTYLGLAGASVDLNSIITAGTYYQNDAASGTISKNYPKDVVAGSLLVLQGATSNLVKQIFYPYNGAFSGRVFYSRQYNTGVWTAWASHASSRVDQTAGRVIYQWDDINNREQLTWGDTGWRELSVTSLVNGWTANSVILRRYNNLVSLKIFNLASASATSDIFLPPATLTGFTRTHGAGGLLIPKDPTTVAFLSLASGGLTFGSRVGTYCTMGYTEVQWTTVDAWPTTLPGTASGSVPNV